MEYLFQVTGPTAPPVRRPTPATRVGRGVRREVRARDAGLPAAALAGGRRPAGDGAGHRLRARWTATCRSRCGARPGWRPACPLRCSSCTTVRSTTYWPASRRTSVPWSGRRAAAGAGRAARAGPSRRAVLRGRCLHPGAVPRRPPPAAARDRGHGDASAWAPASGRWRCCTPSGPTPGCVRRAVPAVRLVLPPAARRARTPVRAVRPGRAQRRQVLRAGGHPRPVPTVMTCGTLEENLANNRIMARALAAQGYDVTLREVRDVHSYTAWRDAFDPSLTGLLREVDRQHRPREDPAVTRSLELGSRERLPRPGRVHGHWGRPVSCSRPRPAGPVTSRTTAWSRQSGGCSTPAGSSSTASTRPTRPPGRTGRSRSSGGPSGTTTTSGGCSTRSCPSCTATAAA